MEPGDLNKLKFKLGSNLVFAKIMGFLFIEETIS
jgi:hypothetical protein